MDLGQGFGRTGWRRFGSGEALVTGLDDDRALPAYGVNDFLEQMAAHHRDLTTDGGVGDRHAKLCRWFARSCRRRQQQATT